jgi:hypothetical protein
VGMDLLGNHGDERFSASAWRECLERAIEFGWEPEGTVAPTDWLGEWDGGYFVTLMISANTKGLRHLLQPIVAMVEVHPW